MPECVEHIDPPAGGASNSQSGEGSTLGLIVRKQPAGSRRRASRPFFFNWMSRCRLMQCSALHGTDLCEQREHIEVVRGALNLAALDLDDLACRHLDRLVRCRNGTRWCLQRSGVNALPHELENGGVPACELAHECGLGVGDSLGPALPGLDDLAGALDATVSSLFVVHGVGSQRVLRLAPVLFVICGDCG